MALQREQVVQTAEKYVSRGKIEPAIQRVPQAPRREPERHQHPEPGGRPLRAHPAHRRGRRILRADRQHYSSSGFFVKAIAIYKKIIKLDPTRLDVYEQLAELYHKQGLVTEARTQYQVLADYYQKHDNAASAIAIYIKMADLEPENPTYHVKLAEIYHQQQLIEKAMGEYRIIAELMIQHGRTQEAGQVYERALDVDSKNLRFIREGIERLRAAGDTAAAAHLLAVAAERNPEVHAFAEERIEERIEERKAETALETELAEEPEAIAVPYVEEEPDPRFLAREPEPVAEAAVEEEAAFEFEIDLGDDLMAAMREAEAAVGGEPAAAAAPAVSADTDEIEIELSFDEEDVGGLVLDMEAVAEEDEPSSQVRPPDDLLAAPSRPAWAVPEEPAVEAAEEFEASSWRSRTSRWRPSPARPSFAVQPLPATPEPVSEPVSEPEREPEPVREEPRPEIRRRRTSATSWSPRPRCWPSTASKRRPSSAWKRRCRSVRTTSPPLPCSSGCVWTRGSTTRWPSWRTGWPRWSRPPNRPAGSASPGSPRASGSWTRATRWTATISPDRRAPPCRRSRRFRSLRRLRHPWRRLRSRPPPRRPRRTWTPSCAACSTRRRASPRRRGRPSPSRRPPPPLYRRPRPPRPRPGWPRAAASSTSPPSAR